LGFQETASWAWIGGFFEGEGNIYVSREKNRSVRLLIGQVDKRPLEMIRMFLLHKGIISPMYLRPSKGNHRAAWTLHVNAKADVTYVLKHMRPFLIGKQDQCDDALAFLETIRAGGRRRLLTEEQRAEINDLYDNGWSVLSLGRRFKVGYKAIRSSIIGSMRGNNKSYKICPQCGGRKKWSKNSICLRCEAARRRALAVSRQRHCIVCGHVLSQRKVGKCRVCWLADKRKPLGYRYTRPKEQG
jgi:intein/homing endonuclease